MSNKDATIFQLATSVRGVLSDETMDYSAKKNIIEPMLFVLAGRIQNINSVLFESIPYQMTEYDVAALFELVYQSASSLGQIHRYVENFVWRGIVTLPYKLNRQPDDDNFIELVSDCRMKSYTDEKDRINQLLIRFCIMVLGIVHKKQNTSTRSENVLKMLVDMLNYYNIPECYAVFRTYMQKKDSKEQLLALEGLDILFWRHADTVPDELLKELIAIKKRTKSSEVAELCMQIENNVK